MCESGFDVKITIFTTMEYSRSQNYQLRRYCYRSQKFVEPSVERFNSTVKLTLTGYHRPYMKQRLEDFDLFIYSKL
jgi:hypothetical protein